ncbi:MAG: TerC family protein [Candidatus Tectimicrobiota bacterium]
MPHQLLLWGGFGLFVLIMLAIDLGVAHRQAHEVSVKEALRWSAVWIGLALLFNIGVYIWQGADPALAFFTGYLLEKALSVDNLFVFLLILSYFSVPTVYQHKVLFWGILGALLMRAVMIAVGAALIAQFHWIIYLFGGFLVFTGIKMAFQKEEAVHPEQNPVVRLVSRFIPITHAYDGERFFVRQEGRLFATPLFVVLLMVETTDVIFALDSIPAILAITTDPFIVYTSNVFAIMGLRSLFFALAGIMGLFHYLRLGLALVLSFIGVKMALAEVFHLPVHWALGVVAGILAASIIASLLFPPTPAVQPSGEVPLSEHQA